MPGGGRNADRAGRSGRAGTEKKNVYVDTDDDNKKRIIAVNTIQMGQKCGMKLREQMSPEGD